MGERSGIPGSVRFASSWEGLVAVVRDRLALAGDVLVQRFTAGSVSVSRPS